MSIELAAKCVPYLLVLGVGFSIGIHFRGNPPKRTRKTRKPKALSNEATGENK